ncbi:nitroreductase family protein [Roseibium marinum]|uniref:Nitroreductase n=1 Tax=Roseibium marinum TaxID=281252 RepID=A0A2S3UWT6_9HYPH|nr:nitroreductase family protein [Roseibium marinum]POF32167.1 nitroreductase [Roseibium marinum]
MSGSLLEPRPPFSRQIRSLSALFANGFRDARRFWRSSFTGHVKSRENLRARIAISLHFLEYGGALKGSAQGHGLDRALMLASDIDSYIGHFGPDATTEIALRTLEDYLAFNEGSGQDLDAIAQVVARHGKGASTGLRGGVETVTSEDIRAAGMIDFLSFAQARHSIRTYAQGEVPRVSIERAVRAAQQSPSSCNRQTCRAHVWTAPQSVERVLSLQNGNRGFGDQLGGVAVITSDLSHWEHAHERYQAWVDGGMFAMSFAYGLHAEGLGAVMLNWSVTHDQDRRLRRLTGLPESDLVITMVGFGLLPKTLKVPVSQRKPLDYALVLNAPLCAAG